jgi:glutamate racemase
LQLCSWLISQSCSAVVVACNTATAQAIDQIRKKFPQIPIIGIEPGIKPAAALSQTKKVGVLATASTLQSEKFNALLATLLGDCEFITQAGVGLVPLIETGDLQHPQLEQLLIQYINPMVQANADTLVLGCTHYPFLESLIQKLFGPNLYVINTSSAVIKQMCRLIPEVTISQPGSVTYYSTQNSVQLETLAKKLMSHQRTRQVSSEMVAI